MQYLVSVLFDSPDFIADPEEEAAIDVFNQKLVENGHFVFAAGLSLPTSATTIDNRKGVGEAILLDGPYVETKEFMAGLWIWEADNLDVALALATEASKACNRRIEVRPILAHE